jgi:hypothetical protein
MMSVNDDPTDDAENGDDDDEVDADNGEDDNGAEDDGRNGMDVDE